MVRFTLGMQTGGGRITDIESTYSAWCMNSPRMRRPGSFHNLGTDDLATIGRAHYHRPSINPRMHVNTLTVGAARDVRGWKEPATRG